MTTKYAANLRRRGAVVLTSLAAVMGLAVAISPATSASIDTAPASAERSATAGPTQVTLHGVGAGTHVITLVTGDRVTLSSVGSGHFTVDVQPSPRADGVQPTFDVEAGPDGTYVVPSDAEPAVAAGRVDRELFDVKYLAENGYADEQMRSIPVIAQYPPGRAQAKVESSASALPASTPTQELQSIHGAALAVPRSTAKSFWASIHSDSAPARGPAVATLDRGLTRLWLDAKVHAELDESVPLIGAPQAWAAGFDGTGVKVAILDTGIDDTHPDLQGKVADSQSFVPGVTSVKDGHGHGTHVASTIAGTGAAENGKYTGVAPGAQLVIGKVLTDGGTGQASWIIAGMQWAAHSGAKVVNMSLGAGPTDGTDPESQAVNNLTAETGTLFVIAAGNSGPGEATVTTPGTADAALTVAATDKSDQLASFSSRGPRAGDGALKPDIAAPGVHITAARAAGTSLCLNSCLQPGDGPVDEFYTSASGTSQATPHVAGSAAILAEEYPDWTAPQLKAALMSTAKDDGYSVYEQGAGRVDVARAFSQKVYATTPNVDFGRLTSAQGGGPISKPVNYTNLTDQPITLTLTPQLHTTSGDPAPDGALTVDATSLTVPAGGTAAATVTLDPASLAKDEYTGGITATADGVHLSTPVGLSNLAKLTIHIVHDIPFGAFVSAVPVELSNGQAPSSAATSAEATESSALVQGTAASDQPGPASLFEGTVTFSVPPGTYSVLANTIWFDAEDIFNRAVMPDPQVSVTDDTDVTLDARQTKQITFTTPRPAQRLVTDQFVERFDTAGVLHLAGTVGSSFDRANRLWALPTEKVTKGVFRFSTQTTMANPQLTMTVERPEHRQLHVLTRAYADRGQEFVSGLEFGSSDDHHWVPFTKDQTLPVVDAGLGDPQDIAGLDLHGKLALLRYGEFNEDFDAQLCTPLFDRVENVRRAGAVGVIFFAVAPCRGVPTRIGFIPAGQSMKLPEAWLTHSEGQHLADQAANGTVRIKVNADPNIRYTYELKQYEEQQIPNSLHYTYTSKDLAQIDTAFHAPGPGMVSVSGWHVFKPGTGTSIIQAASTSAPETRPVYVGPLSSNTVWWEDADVQDNRPATRTPPEPLEILARDEGPYRRFDQPIRASEQHFTVPFAPGTVSLDAIHAADPDTPIIWAFCDMCREGNTFWPRTNLTAGSGQNPGVGLLSRTRRLFRADGQEIPLTPQGPFAQPGFTLPEQLGTYRFIENADWENGSKIDTTWTFTSPGTPTQSTTQRGYACLGLLWNSTDACQPEPLVFLNYDLGDSVGLDNTVAAPGHSTIHVHAYHAQSTQPMPPIAGLKLWASTDDGAHWKQLHVTQKTTGADSTFNASLVYPKLADTTGAVSLKAEAWDTAGNRIEQTLSHAYNLRSAP